MRGNNAPELGVRHPFKIGKSLKNPRDSRHMLALKFMHIPDKVALSQPGTLSRTANECVVQLPTADGASSVHFTGTRFTRPDSSVHDYVLVFVDGKIWLERTADYFYIRALDTANSIRPPPELPAPMDEDDGPDSWDPASGSPITPEDDLSMEPEIPPVHPPRTAGKSTPPMGSRPRGKFITGGRLDNAKPGFNSSPTTAAKSVGTKSLAGKGLSNANGPVGRRRPADDDDDDDDDKGSDGSSSEEDDSDDSDSDSDSDSADYTDRSSDEE